MESGTQSIDSSAAWLNKVEAAIEDARRVLNPLRFNSWEWCEPEFLEALNWLNVRPERLHQGEYLGKTPGTDIWRLLLPEAFGSRQIVYKHLDCYTMKYWERLGKSPVFHEVEMKAIFKALGIGTTNYLACCEWRNVGFLRSSSIFYDFVDNVCDGSQLTPTGSLCDNKELVMGVARNVMRDLAKAHQVGCRFPDLKMTFILFPENCDSSNPPLTWINLSHGIFDADKNMFPVIPRDLVHVFVELRLPTRQIKELCYLYLEENKYCGYTATTLWRALTELPINAR